MLQVYIGIIHIIHLRLNLGRNLDNPLLTVIMRYTIPPSDTLVSSPITADSVHADILEHKVPSPLRHHLLCAYLLLFLLFDPLLLSLFHPYTFLCKTLALLEAETLRDFPLSLHELRVRNTCVGRKEVIVKCLSSIDTCEVAGFGHGNKELLASGGMHDEVVDRFVCDGAFALVGGFGGVDVGCSGEHVEDSFCIWDSEVFALKSNVSNVPSNLMLVKCGGFGDVQQEHDLIL
jgi:hypothetical protein